MRVFKAENYLRKDMLVHLARVTCKGSEPEHKHDYVELVYILSGSATQYIDGSVFSVRRGDMLFINYGSTHAFVPQGDLRYINVMFKPEYLSSAFITNDNAFSLLSLTALDEMRNEATPDGVVSFKGVERGEIETLLSGMLSEYSAAQPGYKNVMNGYFTVLITKVARKLCLGGNYATDDVWQQLLQYIDENLNRKLTLSELAEKCFYNPSYFSRVFKEKFGITLVDYINKRRSEAAAQLFCETNLSAAEIAEQSGFGDKTGLYRNFSRYMGCTPGEYKKSKKMQLNK